MATLVRWNPFDDMVTFRRAMDQMFNEGFERPARSRAGTNGSVAMGRLPIDLYETDDDLVIKFRLPGVDPDDVDITVNGEELIIKAELASDARLEDAKGWKWYRHELYHGDIGRRITLPTQVESDNAEATFRNGEVTLVLPKAEAVKPRNIKVTTVK